MSNRQPEENDNLLKFIASTVEMIRDRMVTKEDVEPLVTKEEFEPVREQVAFLGGQVEMILDRMATKDDTARLETRMDKLEGRMGGLEVKVDRLEVETTIIRGGVEQVHLRLDGIEKALSSRLDHVESEMSRMRSVLYLLVKDRPDMLRLLGQAPPAGG